MRGKLKLGFDLLHDRQNRVASQFGLTFAFPEDLKGVYGAFGLDLAHFNGDSSWTLPMPARFIIDRNSRITYAEVNPDYTRRPEPEDTVNALRQMNAVPQRA